MAEGFTLLELSGATLPSTASFIPPDAAGGWRDILSLTGVALIGVVGETGPGDGGNPQTFKLTWRPRRGR